MKQKERQLKILNLLDEEKEVSVEDLAQKFNVSASTIRRELNNMNQLGLIDVMFITKCLCKKATRRRFSLKMAFKLCVTMTMVK